MLEKALEHARLHRTDYLEELFEFLRIPSVSTLSERRPDVERAAAWLADRLLDAGLSEARVMPTGGHPVVYGEWLGAGDDAPTVLVYGHYDVQPTDPLDLWDSPPFEPQMRDGRIYARGASDDKGQAYVQVKAVGAMLAATGSLPVNVKMFFEGEEEIGSPNLDPFIDENLALLAADSGLISDGRILSPEQPSIVYALRGLSYMEFRLRGPMRDLHSGTYGGSIHNPAQLVGEIIAALHDENGTVTIPGFYDNVRLLSEAERAALAEVPYTLAQWQGETGLETPWGEPDYTLLERVTSRPTCEVNGIWGGFQGEGSKTVIPAEAGAKVSMRLVPDQDPGRISRLFTDYVIRLAGEQVEIEVLNHSEAWPSIAPIDLPEMGAAARAYEATWDVKPVYTREGGSIPVVTSIQRKLNAPVILMGFGLDDNIHSPNEHFSVDHFYKGIDTVIHYYHYLSEL